MKRFLLTKLEPLLRIRLHCFDIVMFSIVMGTFDYIRYTGSALGTKVRRRYCLSPGHWTGTEVLGSRQAGARMGQSLTKGRLKVAIPRLSTLVVSSTKSNFAPLIAIPGPNLYDCQHTSFFNWYSVLAHSPSPPVLVRAHVHVHVHGHCEPSGLCFQVSTYVTADHSRLQSLMGPADEVRYYDLRFAPSSGKFLPF